MDPIKTGRLIQQLRTENRLTQKQLADRLHVSDKAVSKWECGNGCPDVSVLTELADVFGTDVQILLSGTMGKKEREKGNMKHTKFYVCKSCGNLIAATSEADVTCCGRRLAALPPQKAVQEHLLRVEETDGALFVSSDHPMTKDHFISFVALVRNNTVYLCKQYPEWNLQALFPLYRSGKLVWYCTQDGLFSQSI